MRRRRSRMPGGSDDGARVLGEARLLLVQLVAERARLLIERAALASTTSPLLGIVGIGADVAGLDERAASIDGLTEQIDRFIVGAFPRMAARCEAGEPGLCVRLRETTRRILVAVGGSSPVADTADDVRELVAGVRDDVSPVLMKAAMLAGGLGGAVAGGYLAGAFGAGVGARVVAGVAGGAAGAGVAHLAAKAAGLG